MPTALHTRIPVPTLTGGVGHNLPQEAPEAFAKAVVDVDALDRQ
jgi:hypothetical protein